MNVDQLDNHLDYTLPPAKRLEVDAILTRESNRGLVFTPADCPVVNIAYINHSSVEAVAQIHAGAKGIIGNIVGQALHEFARDGLSPRTAVAYIGPHSRQYSLYGDRLEEAFQHNLQPYLTPILASDHEHFNMALAIRDQLTEAGMREYRIETSEADTALDGHYFSHRTQSLLPKDVTQLSHPATPPFGRNGVMFLKKKDPS